MTNVFLTTMRFHTFIILFGIATLSPSLNAARAAEPELPRSFLATGLTQLSDDCGPVSVKDGIVRMPGGNISKRCYLRMERNNWATQSFRADVTVMVQGGDGPGCAFFGMGRCEAEPNFFDEPLKEPVIYARLGSSNYVKGAMWTWGSANSSHGSTSIGDGRHRVRMTWDATKRRALFEVDANWDGKTFHDDSWDTVRAQGVKFGADNAHLFVGGTNLPGFADVEVETLSAEEIAAVDFHDRIIRESFSNDPTPEAVQQEITVPLYYTGLTQTARIREQEGKAKSYTLTRDYWVNLSLDTPANGYTWFVVE